MENGATLKKSYFAYQDPKLKFRNLGKLRLAMPSLPKAKSGNDGTDELFQHSPSKENIYKTTSNLKLHEVDNNI